MEDAMRLCLALSALAFLAPGVAWASEAAQVNQANRLFQQGKFTDAVEKYQAALQDGKNASPLLEYNLGTGLYKKGDYTASIEHLGKALDPKAAQLQPLALYNLGDAFYKRGISQEDKNIDGAIADLQQSISNFEQVLKIDAKDGDAQYNKKFVEKELQRLKKKKEQQQQQQQNEEQGRKKSQESQQQKSEQEQDKQSKGQEPQQPPPQNKENENSQDQQQKKDNPRPSEEPQKGNKDNNQNQKEDQGRQEQEDQGEADDMLRKEAKDNLEDYERNEEPKALLNFVPKEKTERPVLRDW